MKQILHPALNFFHTGGESEQEQVHVYRSMGVMTETCT